MRVLAFGTYDVRAHPRVGVLLEGLRAHGHDVVEVNEPLGLDTAARVAILRQPWRLPLLLWRLLRCWAVLAVRTRRAVRRGRPDAVLVGYLGHFDVHLARRLLPGVPVVLDHLVSAAGTAQDRGLTGRRGPKARLMEEIDRRALAAADVVVVDTAQHLDALPASVRPRAVVCPVGAGAAWFGAGSTAGCTAGSAAGIAGGPLRVVFVGLFTPLHGTLVLAQALALLADDPRIEVTMVGTGQDHDAARRVAAGNPRVAWVDWVPAEELPAYVAGHDVSLGIFGTTPKALRVVPTKVFQGAAAGTVVVTSDTDPQRAALGDAAVLVPPGDPAALASTLRRLADSPAEVARLRDLAAATARQRFTAAASARPLADRLALLCARPAAEETTMPPTTSQPLPALSLRASLRYDLVKRVLDRLAPRTALEIGCGQGAFGARLAERAAYVGVEPDEHSHTVARTRIEPRGGQVLHGIHTVVPTGSTYDVVCAFEVLEHIEDDRAALADWVEFVRPGGHLVMSVPAFQERFGPMDTHAGHFRRYSPDQLRTLLEAAGLTDVEITVYGWPLGYALEAVRNRIDEKKLRRVGNASKEELTHASGRTFQPSEGSGQLVRIATAPWRLLQRLRPAAGIGLVAVARRPD